MSQDNSRVPYRVGEMVYDTGRKQAREFVEVALATAEGVPLLLTLKGPNGFLEDVPVSEIGVLFEEDPFDALFILASTEE